MIQNITKLKKYIPTVVVFVLVVLCITIIRDILGIDQIPDRPRVHDNHLLFLNTIWIVYLVMSFSSVVASFRLYKREEDPNQDPNLRDKEKRDALYVLTGLLLTIVFIQRIMIKLYGKVLFHYVFSTFFLAILLCLLTATIVIFFRTGHYLYYNSSLEYKQKEDEKMSLIFNASKPYVQVLISSAIIVLCINTIIYIFYGKMVFLNIYTYFFQVALILIFLFSLVIIYIFFAEGYYQDIPGYFIIDNISKRITLFISYLQNKITIFILYIRNTIITFNSYMQNKIIIFNAYLQNKVTILISYIRNFSKK